MIKFLLSLAYLVVAVPFVVTAIRASVAAGNDKETPGMTWAWTILLWLGGWFLLSMSLWATSVYTDVLWFKELGQTERYWTVFQNKLILFFAGGCLAAVLMLAGGVANYLFLRKSKLSDDTKGLMFLITILFSIFSFFVFGFWANNSWDTILQHFNAVSMGVEDPIFHKDAGFYMFHLPFYKMIGTMVLVFAILHLIQTIGHALVSGMTETRNRWNENSIGMNSTGLVALAPMIFLGLAFLGGAMLYMWYLGPYGFVVSGGGGTVPFGANFMDVQYRIGFNKVMMWVIAFSSVMFLAGVAVRSVNMRLLLGIAPTAIFFIAWIAFGAIVPAAVQQLKGVESNELAFEQPYIEQNIRFTRLGYGLENVEEREMNPVLKDVKPEDILGERGTLNNVRLADWRPLHDTFRQRQALRPYYEFPDIDIDRYIVNGEYRQVMLSPRELNQDLLSPGAKRWVNTRLKYTHGYGVVIIPVNEFDRDGFPRLLVKDIPPVSEVSEIKVSSPEIYFGDRTVPNVIVNTAEDEFDYPLGDENALSRYEGKAGVALGSKLSLRRFALANRFDGLKFYTSNSLSGDSRVLYHRSLENRVKKLAPFLEYDHDPYLVVDSEGRLFWMWDAYTTSSKFPYSTPHEGYNYIRNSVKVTVDAYNGTVKFYVFDENDPVLKVWRNIFPALFTPKSEMPSDLAAHIRYPETLLLAQSEMYGAYHMQNPQTFFNKEDVWVFAKEKYHDKVRTVIPYYTIMNLPGETKQEFLLMIPFTPRGTLEQQRHNMIAWMAGRSDGEHYGKLVVYRLPKNSFMPGPLQVESYVDSDTEMAEQITLWDQKGSEVIRGNLLAIPIANTILYVEPIYLQAEDKDASLPKLQRVMVSIGETVAWGPNLEEALSNLFKKMDGSYVPSARSRDGTSGEIALTDDVTVLIAQAVTHFNNYLALTGQGKVVEAAQELAQHREVLLKLQTVTEQK